MKTKEDSLSGLISLVRIEEPEQKKGKKQTPEGGSLQCRPQEKLGALNFRGSNHRKPDRKWEKEVLLPLLS